MELVYFLATIIGCILGLIVFFKISFYFQRKTIRKAMKRNILLEGYGTTSIPISKLADLNIEDLSVLEDYLYDIFLEFENALNSLDYNTMGRLTTSKLYNLYHTDITLNVKAGRKKIIKDIKRKSVLVYDAYVSDERQMIYSIIDVEFVSYTIDSNGRIISGTTSPVRESFDIIFTKKYSSDEVIKCPNCGNSVLGSVCNYCRTNLRNKDFKMENIKKIVKKNV